MAKLQDVFGSGAIGSRPAAAKEGYHYFATDEGILYRDSGTAWVAVSARGLTFAFSTTTADADPGAGTLRFNHGTPASVTILYVDDLCLNSDADLGTVWNAITGARLLITQADDPAKYLLVEVTADADGTGYWKLTSTVDASGTLPDDGALLNVQVLGGGSGGGGGATTQWWDRPGAPEGWIASFQNKLIFGSSTQPTPLGVTHQAPEVGSGSYGGELVVGCGDLQDVSPTVASNTGLQWISTNNEWYHGAYGLLQARWPVGVLNNLFWGFFATTVPAPAPTTAQGGVMFVKRSADSNWFVAHGPGDSATAWTFIDTGVAWNAANWHNFELDVYNDGGTLKCKAYIDGVEVADITSNMPAPTLKMDRVYCTMQPQAGFDTVNDDIGIFIRSMKWLQGVGTELQDFA